MNPFYLKNRHLFEEERDVPYQYSTDKLRNLGPKLLTEPRIVRDFSKERESPSLGGPGINVFSQNAKSLLTNNPYNDPVVPSLEKENQMSRRDSYSNLLSNYQSHNPSYQSPEPKFSNPYNPLTLQEPFKPDLYSFPKINDYKSIPSVNHIKPALKSNQLPATLDLYNPVIQQTSQLDNSKQAMGGVSSRGKPPISRGNYQEPIRANIMPPVNNVNRSDYESVARERNNPNPNPKDIATITMELLKGNLNNNPNKNHIPASFQSKITERLSSNLPEQPSYPTKITERLSSNLPEQPSYSIQNYPITSNLQAKIQERYSSILSQTDQPEIRRSVGIRRDPVEEELQKQILKQREIEKEDRQRYNEYPDHVSPQPKESGKLKLKESIKESVQHNVFPVSAYTMMKKKMFNMRGDYNTLDNTPFLREKAILVSHLQIRADQLQALGSHKTVQEALERRLIASVKTERKEKLRALLRNEGVIN